MRCTDHLAVDLDGDGSLQQFQADDHAQGAFFTDQGALETGQRAVLDADRLADTNNGPGLRGEAGGQDGPDGDDFIFGDRGRKVSEAHDGGDARGDEHGKAALVIEAAEYIAGEQRKLHGFGSIGPAAPGTVKREKVLESPVAKGLGHGLFVPGPDGEGKPTVLLGYSFGQGYRSVSPIRPIERLGVPNDKYSNILAYKANTRKSVFCT